MGLFSIIGKGFKTTKYQTQVTTLLDAENPAYMRVVNSSYRSLNFFIDFCHEAWRNEASVKECASLFVTAMITEHSFLETRQDKKNFYLKQAADDPNWYVDAVILKMENEPRWKQNFTNHPSEVLVVLDMVEEFETNYRNSGVSAEEHAIEMVSFFTDGPMRVAVQAAMAKDLAAFKQRIMSAPKSQ
jgi:hypothetical protein